MLCSVKVRGANEKALPRVRDFCLVEKLFSTPLAFHPLSTWPTLHLYNVYLHVYNDTPWPA